MALEDWDHHPDGNIAIQPTAGWSIAAIPLGCIVRLEYFPDLAPQDAGRISAIQLHMNADQAAELGQALLNTAARVNSQPKGTAQ